MKSLSVSGSGNETSDANSVRAPRTDEFFRKIYQQANTGIAIADSHRGFQECNPAFCSLLGYTEDELRGVDFASLIHPEDKEANLVQARRLQAGEISSFDIENRFIRKNGELVWVHKFVSVLPGESAHFIALVTDMTWRHQAEEMLRAGEQRLRMALDAAGAGTWSRDIRTGHAEWDERIKAMYGFPGGTKPSLETFAASLHPEDRQRVLDRMNEVRSTPGDDIWSMEYRTVRPDGTVVWIQCFGRVERDGLGQVVRLSGINLDITERKRREANSVFSADVIADISRLSSGDAIMQCFGEKVAAFLQVSAVTYWDIDEERNEARLHSRWGASDMPAPPAIIRLSDYSSSEFSRALRSGEAIVVSDTEKDPRVDAIARRAFRVRSAVCVPFFQEGKWKFALNLLDSNPRDWRKDEIELIEELAHSLFPRLERARAEEALRESEERYRGFAEQVSDGIFVTDSQGRYVDANSAGCEMFGYPLEELRTITVSDVIPSDEHHRLPEQFARLAQGEIVRNDWRFRRKDGSMFIGELVCRQFNDGRLQGVVRDVTERKQMEVALRDEARRKDEFLALLGHELRNPLAAISTAMQVLSAGVTAVRRAEIEGMVDRQVTLMRRLLDDLLDLGRITHGHIELKKERIDLAEFIHKEAASLHSTIAGRRQELLLRLPPESVQFMADRMRLEQIVVNVLTNASKYTGPGGTIEFSGAREGSEVVVHCKDTGQGILPEYKEKIFEPFIRGRNKNDSPGEASLGIGLALAKQLTELHGGTISVESAGEGMGSDFMIRLPLVAPPSERNISVEGKPVGPASRGLSIVFVEDNSDIAQLMGFALKQVGHSVHIFADGSSALARIADLRPNVVLLDIGLPGMDGYELAAEMKRVANMRNTMFIALSGFKRRELDQKDQGHFDHYFTKPVDVRALLNLLDESSRPLRILLVEDHADLAAATQAILRDEGYDVQTAMTGRAALQMAQNFRPQLILCDMNLPDMHGLEVIRALRSDPPTVDMHAVVLAAMSETEIRAYESKAGEFGVDAFMSKPIRPDAVRKLVSKLSATRRS